MIESKEGDPPQSLRSDHLSKRSYVYLKWLWKVIYLQSLINWRID